MTLLFAIISLSILLILHELGHFLLAKLFNLRIDEFSLGLPPRIFGIKIGEVTYSFNAIPFGAFVKIDEDDDPHDNRSFVNQAFYKKALILLGGVGMNFLVAFLIFILLFTFGFPKALIPPNYVLINNTSSTLIRYPFFQAVSETIRFLNFIFLESLKGLKIALIKIITSLNVNDLLGPVGVVAVITRSFEYGWRYIIYILGLISYSLAIFNLLPIPALDGGRLVFVALGKLFKKPISQKTENLIDSITFVLLILLAILVTIKDIRFFYLH